ncbi:hypothetical protein AnigIFM50267_011836 [Aspergillus niger]|nr:hypothetical protein AnigIFM50267_011836 [Aspergillus niger]
MHCSLQVDVYVAPAIQAVTGLEEPAKQLWSPICCTLIQGPTSAVLVDTPTTIELARGLSDWVKKTASGKKVKYIFTTHAHGDHFFGNPILLEDFPEAKCVATAFVAQGIREAVTKEGMDFWKAIFPSGQIPAGQFVPTILPANGEFSIDGHSFFGIDVAFSDTTYSSFLHVPDLELVVAGDIVYGECFQHLGEANTSEKRKHWLHALNQIAMLKPSMVVPGHKRESQVDGPYLIQMTKDYIMAFEEELKRWEDPAKVEKSMKKRYPARWNDFILDRSCVASVAERLETMNKASI